MSTKKFSPNWKYVVGEIILIFLGISLAISFQNWNQNRILKKEQLIAQNDLKVGLETVIVEFNEFIEREDGYLDLMLLLSQEHTLDSIAQLNEFDSLVHNGLFNFGTISANFPSYEALKNSGQINLINDQALKVKLGHLETGFQSFVQSIKEQLDLQIKNIDPVILAYFDFPRLHEGYYKLGTKHISQNKNHLKILKSPEVQNVISYKAAIARGIKGEIVVLIKECKDVLDEFEN